MDANTPPRQGAPKELRLALVCYGGVSLAIYMHGVTKEIHKLVAASRAFDEQPDANPFPSSCTEHAYWNALQALAVREGAATQVVVDIVSGTSAGGINGVFLAKALAHDLSQDALRDLWMDKGDIGQLLNGPEHLPAPAKAAWLVSRTAVRPKTAPSPLSGSRMSQWLFEALRGMDAAPVSRPGGSLMPPGHVLELFVTATDYYGFGRSIPTASGEARDRSHRHVLTFRLDPSAGVDHFAGSPSHNAGLAFAARVTSSFPGAFPPVSIHSFQNQLPDKGLDAAGFDSDLFRIYSLEDDDPRQTYFVDGGTLDNFPFGHAIDAIRARPADREVKRRLLYLQPDPGEAPKPAPGKEPGLLATVWKTMSSIPRNEPIVDDLLRVRATNEQVRTIREVIETSFGPIRGEVLKLGEASGGYSPDASPEQIERWQADIHDAAQRLGAFYYPSYVRLKLHSVVEGFGSGISRICEFPAQSDHAFFVRSLMHAWGEKLRLFERAQPPSKVQVDYLKSFDVHYRLRRLQFLISGVNWLYTEPSPPPPPRADLDRAKKALYSLVEQVKAIISGAALPDELKRQVRSVFDEQRCRRAWEASRWDPAVYLEGFEPDLGPLSEQLRVFLESELAEIGQELYYSFLEIAEGWHPDTRNDLLVRYLGFPIWDAVLYPVHGLTNLSEHDAVDVARMSPDEATLVERGGAKAKLKGVGFHHFAAFFKRAWRENDYVWGRLDGAELLMRMLLGDADSQHLRTALQAVVHEERGLKGAGAAFAAVDRFLRSPGSGASAGPSQERLPHAAGRSRG